MDSEGESRSLSKIVVMIFQFLQGFLADPNVRSIMSVVNDWVPCREKNGAVQRQQQCRLLKKRQYLIAEGQGKANALLRGTLSDLSCICIICIVWSPQISTVILMIPVTSVLMSFLNYTASLAVCFSAVSGISRSVPLEMTQGPDRHSASRFFRWTRRRTTLYM